MAELSPIIAVPYMSVVEGRHPKQKVHKTLAHAKAAFDTPKLNPDVTSPEHPRWTQRTHGWGTLYEFKDGQWVVLYEVPKPTQDDLIVTEHSSWTKYDWETRPWKLKD